MNAKDIVSKRLIKRIATDVAQLLLGLPVDEIEVIDGESLRVEERRADLAARVRAGGDEYLLHVEIQNDNLGNMPWRMLRYRTDLALGHPGLPIRQYLIYIGRAPLRMAEGIQEPDLDYRYRVIDMHGVDCATLLAQETPDALVLAILCDFRERPAREVIRYILTRLQQLTGEDEGGFRDYLLMLEILSTNRELRDLLQEEETMLSQVKYSDLPSYDLGMQEGHREGHREGRREGRREGEGKFLKRLLERRFGLLPDAIAARIAGATEDELERWADELLTAPSLEAIFGEGRH